MKMVKDLQMVGFHIGNEVFGVPIALVQEIVRVPEITAVPDAPPCVEGVINLRGKIVPVIDLRKRFGEPAMGDGKNRILVVEVEGRRVGLLVDAASDVLKIPPAEIENPPTLCAEGELNYITGVGKLGGRLIILIDLGKVLRRGELKSISELQLRMAAAAEGPGTGNCL